MFDDDVHGNMPPPIEGILEQQPYAPLPSPVLEHPTQKRSPGAGRDSVAVRIVAPVLFLVLLTVAFTFVAFIIIESFPGDPIHILLGADATEEEYEAYRAESGLDRPLIVRYGRMFIGDFGTSWVTRQPVSQLLKERLPSTIKLILASLIITYIIALPLGILSAVKRGKTVDTVFNIFSVICKSVPFFWLALILLMILSLNLGLLPVAGANTWIGYIIPVFVLVFSYVGFAMQAVRATSVRAINYGNTGLNFRESGADGIGKSAIMQDAMLPSIAKSGLQLGWLAIGVVVIDTVSSLPGVGSLLMVGLMNRDMPVIFGGVMALSLCFLVAAAVFSFIITGIIYVLRLKAR